MLVDISRALGGYLQDVFVGNLDWGILIGYVEVKDRPRLNGTSNYGFWYRLWIGMVDLVGVWWLIRRKKRIPQSVEVTLAR